MARRYDVIVVDLDGTLLGSDGTVSGRNREAIDRARDAGYVVIIATGRALVESREAIDAIEHDGYVIAAGGSLLCEASSGATIERRVMARGIVADAAEVLVDCGHRTLVLKDHHAAGYEYLVVGRGELDPASQWWFETLPVRLRFIESIDEDPDPHDTVRVGVVSGASELAPLAERLRRDLGESIFLQHWAAVTATSATGSSTHLLEIFDPEVNKWTMLEALCRREGFDPGRIAAIGDGLNDVEMLANAGMGVAMENADEAVARHARNRTGHHDRDGLAHAVDRIVDGDW
jgi:HAD superfamily hydrolase (TIGR01484 family)